MSKQNNKEENSETCRAAELWPFMGIMDILLIILSLICMVCGLAGSIFPVLPGTPLAFVSLLLLKFSSYGVKISRIWICVFAVFVIISFISDYLLTVWGTKKFGGTKAGIWGAVIGAFAGIFFLPAGIIAGPFLGAFAGEMIAGKSAGHSLKAAAGSFIGFLAGTGFKLIVCLWIAVYAVLKLFF